MGDKVPAEEETKGLNSQKRDVLFSHAGEEIFRVFNKIHGEDNG